MADLIRADNLGVPHGFLDAAQSDAHDIALAVGDMAVAFLKQVHSADAIGVTEPFAEGSRPEVDGMATATPGLALAIVTADCAPVLLADEAAGVIGAAHAGWRGAWGGVLEATLAQMERLGASRARIGAVIGPTIAAESYEVDEEFRDIFCSGESGNHWFFDEGAPGHYQFDLPAYVGSRLRKSGISNIVDLGLDTYAGAPRFHSYRRATHRGEPTTGRQISLIALPKRPQA